MQDNQILSSLIEKDKQTSYLLSQNTKISIPQINFRLAKLVEYQVVTESKEEDKTVYSIHDSLKSKTAIKKVSEHIKEISDIIDKEHYATSEGIKTILCFILSKTEISDSEVLAEEQKIVDGFKKVLEEYAENNDLALNYVKGWTDNKIRKMALNNRICACDSKRICPCKEGLTEINTTGTCKCSIFGDKKWLKRMDKKLKSMK